MAASKQGQDERMGASNGASPPAAPENTFEDEDDFEEFERCDYKDDNVKHDLGTWNNAWDAAGWDDEDPHDEFTRQLKAELDRQLKVEYDKALQKRKGVQPNRPAGGPATN
uniref:Uncharacterized protein n=1 Tax=Chromera velia CCMP2878 TaxID=1169474 RepID=A0A0G4F6S5_9ALVE|mmetsp:Transcript_42949/g.84698  ORF Transcript_42949/g.84698 Transcript_42949/m.84698 type:complete len:111 (-) Transcript_42949:134-466(-)|eukprot:Cvel_15492.t1-p1 / transcript=Cvel_15492.t1 / gene=Cvel_15492 / organism=Chromera_velia_CCMP2878 / gene_product=hypothetical protein / transcript_product=hypothetical protein / location=Cvel_scaffold1149:37761-39265(+) / protein_length=110 / sequence_SO=supercontig / SO=protein_coding / is_pseudo=false